MRGSRRLSRCTGGAALPVVLLLLPAAALTQGASPRYAADPAVKADHSHAAAEERVVVIDPGHGGRDPGTVGPGNIREKDVTLAVGLGLAEVLRDRGYEVHLTRSDDRYISLLERPRLANEWKVDRPASLFLSLHANASQPSARGFETFFLSEARTEDERRVAEMENAAVEYDDDGNSTPPGPESILRSLQNNYYMWASYDLAEVIQNGLAKTHPGPNRGVKQAGFLVLVGAVMPAVLVELGFISDAGEARLLATADFQAELADTLADAVDEFFRVHDWTGGERP